MKFKKQFEKFFEEHAVELDTSSKQAHTAAVTAMFHQMNAELNLAYINYLTNMTNGTKDDAE